MQSLCICECHHRTPYQKPCTWVAALLECSGEELVLKGPWRRAKGLCKLAAPSCCAAAWAQHLTPERRGRVTFTFTLPFSIWLQLTFSNAKHGYSFFFWGVSLPISSHDLPHLSLLLGLLLLNRWHYCSVNIFVKFVPLPRWDLCFDWDVWVFSSGCFRVKPLQQLRNNNSNKKQYNIFKAQ